MTSSVYPNKDVIAASKQVVNIFCNKEDSHGTKKYGTEEWCADNYGLKCEDHVKNHPEKSNKHFPKGTIPNPTTILLTPDGETEMWRKTGKAEGKELCDAIKEAVKKTGAGIGRDEYKFMTEKLAKAEEAFGGNKVKDGIAACNDVIKTFGKMPAAKPMIEKAEKKLDTANEYGREQIAKSKELSTGGDIEGAKAILKEIYANYKGLDCSKEAEKEMAALPKAK
ncbi:MAG: hypothetical protein HYY18_19380 [Planctomycetes bacterium]|nr:hypothetical protein [Planctomycetota bacterium]